MNQEEGWTIEELRLEEEKLVVLCRGGSIPKLIEFVCQRSTLQQLLQHSVQQPVNPNNHDQTHKFPFFAADVLASNAMILQALLEGGWNNAAEQDESNKSMSGEDSDEATRKDNAIANDGMPDLEPNNKAKEDAEMV